MSSKKSSGRRENLPKSLRSQSGRFAIWQVQTPKGDLNGEQCMYHKKHTRPSSTSPTEVSLSEGASDYFSDNDQTTKFLGTVPKLSLPTLYEDEENPITVKISCRKCLEMEVILGNFTEMHIKAFAKCKENPELFWKYLSNWNAQFYKSLERIKYHLIGEFVTQIEQAPLSEFKNDHDFRTQFGHYRLVYTHMRSMENRLAHRQQEVSCPLKENFNLNSSDKASKDIKQKISATCLVLKQMEQRIRSIANSWDNARASTNPHGFRQAIFTKEDYLFNRLSNIFTCLDFLDNESKFYKIKAEGLGASGSKILPLLQLKQNDNATPKPCNIKRRMQNSIKRKLPSGMAHFYPFVKPQQMDDIHASWYRTFLQTDDVRKELHKQRDTNLRVLTDIKQLQNDIKHLETQIKMKEFVDQTVKNDTDADAIFPDKKLDTPSYLDLNSLF